MKRAWTVQNLREELQGYPEDLARLNLAPTTIDSYVDQCERFIAWLEGREHPVRATTGQQRDRRRKWTAVPPRHRSYATPGRIDILDRKDLGAFAWKWPTGEEAYERGWLLIVRAAGHAHEVRHALTMREAFGRPRVRSVTWVDGSPRVEGVETESYPETRLLASLIKSDGRAHLAPGAKLPPGYKDFDVARFSDVVHGPRSWRSMAVLIAEHDAVAWARHALLRAMAKAS